MNCPHCKKEIQFNKTLWRIWYLADLRNRVVLQTGNASLADLVSKPGAGGPAYMAIKAIEEFTAGICLAWHRGTLLTKQLPEPTEAADG